MIKLKPASIFLLSIVLMLSGMSGCSTNSSSEQSISSQTQQAKPATSDVSQSEVVKPGAARDVSELKWTAQAPGLPIQESTLWGDRKEGSSGVLVKLPGGFDSGLHAHTGDYHGVLVAGTWIHIEEGAVGSGKELSPGSYVMQPGKGMHIDKCKPGAECVLFLYQDQKADVILPEK